MIALHIYLNAEGMDQNVLKDGTEIVELKGDINIGALEGGMASGKPSVAITFDLPDGRRAFAQTSMALFLTAAKMFAGKFGWPEDWEN